MKSSHPTIVTMFKQKLAAILAFIAVVIPASAQITAKSAFTTAPSMILPTIDRSTRLDMIDYYESGLHRSSKTLYDSDAVIDTLTGDIAVITNGNTQRITIAVLPQKKGELIMLIESLATPDRDASITFYDSKWQQVPSTKLLPLPTLEDWTGKLSMQESIDVENALPFLLVDAAYDPSTQTLTLTPSVSDYVAREDMPLVTRVMAPELKYIWNGKKFAPLKK